MKEDKDIELDCSKNCKSTVSACEAEGRGRNECENRYNDCASNAPLHEEPCGGRHPSAADFSI